MRIISIFGKNLFAIQHTGETQDEFAKMFELWQELVLSYAENPSENVKTWVQNQSTKLNSRDDTCLVKASQEIEDLITREAIRLNEIDDEATYQEESVNITKLEIAFDEFRDLLWEHEVFLRYDMRVKKGML